MRAEEIEAGEGDVEVRDAFARVREEDVETSGEELEAGEEEIEASEEDLEEGEKATEAGEEDVEAGEEVIDARDEVVGIREEVAGIRGENVGVREERVGFGDEDGRLAVPLRSVLLTLGRRGWPLPVSRLVACVSPLVLRRRTDRRGRSIDSGWPRPLSMSPSQVVSTGAHVVKSTARLPKTEGTSGTRSSRAPRSRPPPRGIR